MRAATAAIARGVVVSFMPDQPPDEFVAIHARDRVAKRAQPAGKRRWPADATEEQVGRGVVAPLQDRLDERSDGKYALRDMRGRYRRGRQQVVLAVGNQVGEVVVPRIHAGEHHRGERPLERACKQEALVGTVGKGASVPGILHEDAEAPAVLPLERGDRVAVVGAGRTGPSGNDRAESCGNEAATGRPSIHIKSFPSAFGGVALLTTERDGTPRSAGLDDDAAEASFVRTAFHAIDNAIMARVVQACFHITGKITAENGLIEKFEKFTLGRRCALSTTGTDVPRISRVRLYGATTDWTILEHDLA